MNSSEQKDFEHITPTEDDIDETIGQLRERLAGTELQEKNDAQEGYELALRILTEKSTDYAGIPLEAGSDVSKTIAVLAINYLKGEVSREVLLHFHAPDAH